MFKKLFFLFIFIFSIALYAETQPRIFIQQPILKSGFAPNDMFGVEVHKKFSSLFLSEGYYVISDDEINQMRAELEAVMAEGGDCDLEECRNNVAAMIGDMINAQYIVSSTLMNVGGKIKIFAELRERDSAKGTVSKKGIAEVDCYRAEVDYYIEEIVRALKDPSYKIKDKADAAGRKKKVAILDIVPTGVEQTYTDIINNLLRVRMGGENKYFVIDSAAMKVDLDSQGISYGGCMAESCATEVGRATGADFVVFGTFVKLDTTYLLTVNMLDLETGITRIGEEEVVRISDVRTALSSIIDKITKRSLKPEFDESDAVLVLEKKIRSAKSGVIRSSAITGATLVAGIITQILGQNDFDLAVEKYAEYENAYLSSTAGTLHNEIIDLGDTADMLFIFSETSFIVSGVFLIWDIFDIARLIKYNNDLEYEKSKLALEIKDGGFEMSLSFKY